MKTSTTRVAKHRAALKKAGMRPIQIWVQDTRSRKFRAEARRESRLIARDPHEKEILDWIERTQEIMKAGVNWKRGSLVTVALPGDYGKPRPALVIQSDAFQELPSVTLLPLTSGLRSAPLMRLSVEPTPANGLEKLSQIMIDKAYTVPLEKIGTSIGRLSEETMLAVNRALAVFLGLA